MDRRKEVMETVRNTKTALQIATEAWKVTLTGSV